jgi:hypothetical protein
LLKIGFAERSEANYGRGYADILPNGISLFSVLENRQFDSAILTESLNKGRLFDIFSVYRGRLLDMGLLMGNLSNRR